MKLAIDCRMIKMSGIGVYLENILPTLFRQNSLDSFLLIGNQEQLSQFADNKNCLFLSCSIPIFSVKELIDFPVSEVNSCDAFYTPNFNIPFGIKVPIYCTIHDVVFLDVKGITSFWGRAIRKLMLRRAVYLATKIFTVSEFSKGRILHYFPTEKEVIVTYNGINSLLKNYASKKPSPYTFKYIVYVGNIKKHKGLGLLLDSFNIAIKNGLLMKLVIVGNSCNFKTQDSDLISKIKEQDDNILFTGWLPSEDVYNTIMHAECLVQPSLYEGFGIPPLEALYLGCSVIVSDIPVFKEIYNDLPVCFFDSRNKMDLVKKLENIEKSSLPKDSIRSIIEKKYNYIYSAEKIYTSIDIQIQK